MHPSCVLRTGRRVLLLGGARFARAVRCSTLALCGDPLVGRRAWACLHGSIQACFRRVRLCHVRLLLHICFYMRATYNAVRNRSVIPCPWPTDSLATQPAYFARTAPSPGHGHGHIRTSTMPADSPWKMMRPPSHPGTLHGWPLQTGAPAPRSAGPSQTTRGRRTGHTRCRVQWQTGGRPGCGKSPRVCARLCKYNKRESECVCVCADCDFDVLETHLLIKKFHHLHIQVASAVRV